MIAKYLSLPKSARLALFIFLVAFSLNVTISSMSRLTILATSAGIQAKAYILVSLVGELFLSGVIAWYFYKVCAKSTHLAGLAKECCAVGLGIVIPLSPLLIDPPAAFLTSFLPGASTSASVPQTAESGIGVDSKSEANKTATATPPVAPVDQPAKVTDKGFTLVFSQQTMKAYDGPREYPALNLTAAEAANDGGNMWKRIAVNQRHEYGDQRNDTTCIFHHYRSGNWLSEFEAGEYGTGSNGPRTYWEPKAGETSSPINLGRCTPVESVKSVHITPASPYLVDIVIAVELTK
jgi:hypothetical protein